MKSIEPGKHPGKPIVPPSAAVASTAHRPETFRLPKSGGDPYFGFGRSFYYRGEQLGYWKLIRIRERGKLRGVTLVPYDSVAQFVRKQMGGGEA
jgi:hypothetical protein